jgi:sugar phosphate isomerase/epimerase
MPIVKARETSDTKLGMIRQAASASSRSVPQRLVDHRRRAPSISACRIVRGGHRIGARHIKVGAGLQRIRCRWHHCRRVSRSADEAADAGWLALEATPFSHLRITPEAVEVVTSSDSPAAGLMIDIWHTYKTGLSHDDCGRSYPSSSGRRR